MKKLNSLSYLLIALLGVVNTYAQEAFISDKLEKVWETSEGFDISESSRYNPNDECIYVSNIVGTHNIKDGIGYISKLNKEGKLLAKEWVKGLNAPKGIACSSDKLYVTDIDRVLEIDLKTAEILKQYKNSNTEELNDVSISPTGKIFVSDSKGNCIFSIGKDSLIVEAQSTELGGMNGIFASDNLLYLGSKGNFISVDQKTKKIKIIAKNVGYLDGIEKIEKDLFITSDWKGGIQLIRLGKGAEKLLDTSPNNINAADLGYIKSQNILLVPTFLNNKIVAYKLKF